MSKKAIKNKSKTIIKKIIDNEIAPYRPDFSTTWYKEIYYWFWRRWNWIRMLPKEIKWKWQRSKNGFADCDVWNLGAYLAEWVPKAIKQLRKNGSGCPDNIFDKTRKYNQCWKWKKVLKEIEDGFESANDIYKDYTINKNKYNKLKKQFENGINLMKKYFFSLWD